MVVVERFESSITTTKKRPVSLLASSPETAYLEAEPETELTGKRARNGRARWVDEVHRLPEGVRTNGPVEVVSIVRTVSKVECLEDELQVALLTEMNVLAEARIQLEERITTHRIIWSDMAVPTEIARLCRESCSVVRRCKHCVVLRIIVGDHNSTSIPASKSKCVIRRQKVVRSGRAELQDRRYLNTPRQVSDAADRDVMTLIVLRRTKLEFREWVPGIAWIVAERSGATVI